MGGAGMKVLLLLLLGGVFVGQAAIVQAQEAVTGTVTDAQSDEPMPGVNIVIKGTTTGTSTGADGTYDIQVESLKDTLVYRYVGYQVQEVPIDGRTEIDVTLQAQTLEGEEIVVTAQNLERESKGLGYSVQEVGPEDMPTSQPTNFVNSLQGVVSGAQVKSSTGTMGGSSRIVLRGVNSISGENQPLFVVDGFPIDNSNFNSTDTQSGEGGAPDYGNTAQDINPNNIKSVSVLKGPNAAALYGSRASNGAILITTKSGEDREGIGIDFSTGAQLISPYGYPDYQNTYGGGYTREFNEFNFDPSRHPDSWSEFDGDPMVEYRSDESWGPKMDGQMVRHWDSWYPSNESFGELRPFEPQPNNVENFFTNGSKVTNSISFYGGGDRATYRASYSNLQQRGILPNSNVGRHNVNLSGKLDLTDKLQVSSKVNYANTNGFGRASVGDYAGRGRMGVMSSYSNWFQRQLDMDRLQDYKNEGGQFKHWNLTSPSQRREPFYWVSPYFEVEENTNNDRRERLFGYLSASYDIRDNLTVSGWARTDFYDDRRERRVARGHVNSSLYAQDIISNREDNFQVLTEYNREYSAFDVGATVGGNIRYSQLKQETLETIGGITAPDFFNSEGSVDRPDVEDFQREKVVYALFGSANIGYKGFAFLDLSLRNDWSSTLPVDNNSYLYPAVSGSFVFSEFVPDNSVLGFGKIRVGWAQVGNDTDPYQLSKNFQPVKGFGSVPTFTVPNTLPNTELEPETTTSVEIGMDLELFNGRIRPDATVYRSASTKQIVELPVTSTSGYSAAVINAGEITNRGIEVSVDGSIIRNPEGFNWDMGLNWSANQNEVVELTEGQDNFQIIGSGQGNGVSLNAREGEPYGTLVGDAVATNENGEKLVGDDGLYIREPNQVLGNIQPDYTGSVTSTFEYKNLSLSAMVDFQKGGDVFSVTSSTGMYAGLLEETVGTNDRGNPIRDPVSEGGGIRLEGVKQNGEPNDTYVEAVDYFKNMQEGQHVYDASFIKMREVSISYDLPQKWFSSVPLRTLSVSVTGRNLGILHKNIPHVDPEATMGSGNIQGYESAQLPRTRTFGFKVSGSL